MGSYIELFYVYLDIILFSYGKRTLSNSSQEEEDKRFKLKATGRYVERHIGF